MLLLKLRKWTATLVEFCSMKTIRRTKSSNAAAVATQAAPARVRAGAPCADGESAPGGAGAVDCSADDDVGGSVAMILESPVSGGLVLGEHGVNLFGGRELAGSGVAVPQGAHSSGRQVDLPAAALQGGGLVDR
jgi:hypothetical protein